MKSALKMSAKDDVQTCEEIARLTEDELRALTKDAFFWGMHPAAMYEMRYFLTQLKGARGYVGNGRMHWDRRRRHWRFRLLRPRNCRWRRRQRSMQHLACR